MSKSHLTKLRMAALAAMFCALAVLVAASAAVLAQGAGARGQGAPRGRGQAAPEPPSAMVNPYRMIENSAAFRRRQVRRSHRDHPGWHRRHMAASSVRAADSSHRCFRRNPQKLRNTMNVQAHGFCRDADGNFWAGDSGPFADVAGAAGRGFPDVQIRSERQGAADAGTGRSVEGRARHVRRTDGLRDCAKW